MKPNHFRFGSNASRNELSRITESIILVTVLIATGCTSAAPTATPTGAATSSAKVTSNSQWTPEFKTFDDGVEMAKVPAGCFTMGSTKGPDEEKPTTQICFDAPFWIDKTEVTQAQFKRLNGKAAKASYSIGEDRPVEEITWFEAQDFCEKRGARLPTEAEWEYAARGPDNLIYPWGNDFSEDNVIFSNNANGKTAPVGSKPTGKSWVGALDMSGNVWEWVSSKYQPYPYSAGDGREDTSDTRTARTLKGGSWGNVDSGVRAAVRRKTPPNTKLDNWGFRCARSANQG